MPESKMRKQPSYTPPPVKSGGIKPNGAWFVPTMCGLLLSGLAWVVVYYVSRGAYPIPKISNWNLGIGFGIMMAGFAMTTRWR